MAAFGVSTRRRRRAERPGRLGVGRQEVERPLCTRAARRSSSAAPPPSVPSSSQTCTSPLSSCSAAWYASSAASRSPSRARDAGLELQQVGAPGRAGLRLAQRVERARPGRRWRAARARTATSASTWFGASWASPSAPATASSARSSASSDRTSPSRAPTSAGSGGARLPVPLERLAVQAALARRCRRAATAHAAAARRRGPRPASARRWPARAAPSLM